MFKVNINKVFYLKDPQAAILDATSEEIQRYFPTPSPRKTVAIQNNNTPSTYMVKQV